MPTGSSSGRGATSLEELLNADYVNESCVHGVLLGRSRWLRPLVAALRHMETYARFLSMTDSEINETASPLLQPESPLLEPRRVRRVTALSDFAPVNMKVRKCVMHLRPGGGI